MMVKRRERMSAHQNSSRKSAVLLIFLIVSIGFVSHVEAAGTWSTTGSMSGGRYAHTATVLADGRVLVAGGAGSSGFLKSAEIYDPALGTWSLTGSMTSVRYFHTATLLPDGRVLVSGGFNGISVVATAEIYNP